MGDDISAKVAHVRAAKQTRDHHCHWPGCERKVPPAMWGCAPHWRRVPARLKLGIWRTYKVGQEQGDAAVSAEYLEAARAVHEWALAQG
jgi:hypothetical protein